MGVLLAVTAVLAGSPTVVDLASDPDAVQLVGEETGDRAGGRMASCDVNGDGIDDLVIGADKADGPDNGRPTSGEVYVVYGHPGAWTGSIDLATRRDLRIIGQDSFDNMGQGVACGDVDGDGFDDIVTCASSADSVDNSRNQAGQAHLVFGGPSLPAQIDLAVDPGTILWGAEPGDTLCNAPSVGDIDGDGLADVIVDADRADNRAGSGTLAGRVHVLFGRTSWPASIDLRTGTDVTIHGESASDFLGENTAVGDVDGDGLEDLLLVAPNADGSGDARAEAGDIHVFLGRPVWPAIIDLAIDSPDMLIFGPDPEDTAGHGRGLDVGDVDGDGLAEVEIGLWRADGRTNAVGFTGEARTFEPGPVLPAVVDLLTDTDTVIYGADELDQSCAGLRAADVDGDGTDDLVCGSVGGDGPGEGRPECGEITVFYGRSPFPTELDIGNDDEDLIIYGALADDALASITLSDVNADGIVEIVAHAAADHPSRLPSVWLISPVDTDQDGIGNLPDNCARQANAGQEDGDGDRVGDVCDNCPATSNTTQADSDQDGFGDACDACPGQPGADASDPDGDGVTNCTDNCPQDPNAGQQDSDVDGLGDACDPCPGDTINDPDGDHLCAAADNCAYVFNATQRDDDGDGVGDLCDVCPGAFDPGQPDADGDGAGDACDCQPADGNDRRPGAITDLTVDRIGAGDARMSWSAPSGSDAYSITRGTLSLLATDQYGGCLAEGIEGTSFDDAASPPANDGFVYLVQGQNFDCGLGPSGHTSDEEERTNLDPSACGGHPHTDAYPVAESTVFGTVSGDLQHVASSDDVVESITEALSSGNPANRFSRLEQRWTIPVSAGARVEFHVEGFRTNSTDADDFVFGYSTDGGVDFTTILLPSLPLGDADADLVALLPSNLSGSILFRVTDTDRTAGNQSLDTVSIDELFVRTIP